MQPYFLPYIGYFQMVNAVDTFVFYDNVTYIKNGWINRNKVLVGGKVKHITLSVHIEDSQASILNTYFANSFVYQDKKRGANMVNGIYHHDKDFQAGWSHGWFSCNLHTGTFVFYNSMRHGPLQ